MDPLMVQRSVGKQVDTLLVYFQPFGRAELLAQILLKFFVRVDDEFTHKEIIF